MPEPIGTPIVIVIVIKSMIAYNLEASADRGLNFSAAVNYLRTSSKCPTSTKGRKKVVSDRYGKAMQHQRR